MQGLEACLAYLKKLPVAVSGAGGHDATFKAALACRRFGLSQSEAWLALKDYNARCQPPWSEKELRHKLDSVLGLGVKKPLGQRRPWQARRAVFVAPAWPKPRRPTAPVRVPVYLRPEAEEEAYWAAVFAERGLPDPGLDPQDAFGSTELIE